MLQVPSYVMLGIPKHEEAPSTPQRPLSAMGEACSRMDLTAIHQILVATHYRDDEGTNEVIKGHNAIVIHLPIFAKMFEFGMV